MLGSLIAPSGDKRGDSLARKAPMYAEADRCIDGAEGLIAAALDDLEEIPLPEGQREPLIYSLLLSEFLQNTKVRIFGVRSASQRHFADVHNDFPTFDRNSAAAEKRVSPQLQGFPAKSILVYCAFISYGLQKRVGRSRTNCSIAS